MLKHDVLNILLPVIFTTAKLWVSDADLSKADIITGNLDIQRDGFKQVDWIWYQYHRSPMLRHTIFNQPDPENFVELMDAEYIRTIAVVGQGGIEKFLLWSSNRNLMSGFAEA